MRPFSISNYCLSKRGMEKERVSVKVRERKWIVGNWGEGIAPLYRVLSVVQKGQPTNNENSQRRESTELLTFTSKASIRHKECESVIKCVYERPTTYHLSLPRKYSALLNFSHCILWWILFFFDIMKFFKDWNCLHMKWFASKSASSKCISAQNTLIRIFWKAEITTHTGFSL